jgi:hypothetical protein
LLLHQFVIYDSSDFDFHKYKKEAIVKQLAFKLAEKLQDEESDSE